MTTAVIGATGRVGSEIVRGVLARGEAVAALVRDPGKARRAFGDPRGLHIRATRLDDPCDLTEAFDGVRTVFIAMGSIGIEGVLQADRDQRRRRDRLDRAGHPLICAQHLAELTGDQPARPLQHRPVRLFDRGAVLDDSPCDLLGVPALRSARGARGAHLDRPRRQRPHGFDRPSRRGRGRSARAH